MTTGRWRLRIVKMTEALERDHVYMSQLRPGDMYYAPWWWEREPKESFAPKAANLRRAPLVVKMPGGRLFCVDQRAYTVEKGWHGEGWRVTGKEPRITVQPSINLEASYHGYIREGFITDDVEGRYFSDDGRLVKP